MILVCFTFYQGFLFGAEDSRGSAKKLQASTSAAVFSANVSALCQTSKARPHQFDHFDPSCRLLCPCFLELKWIWLDLLKWGQLLLIVCIVGMLRL